MKRFITVLAPIALLVAAGPLIAQTETDEIELTRSIIETQRKAIVATNMQLNEAEGRAFWPVYNDYVNDLRKISDRRIRLISDYAKTYEVLTATQATAFLKEHISIEKEELSLVETYVEKFGAVLPPKRVARFFQIENKLNAVVDYEIAAEIPLVK